MHTIDDCTVDALEAALNTLNEKGYTYRGGELWVPPFDKQPSFVMLDYWQARAEKAEHLLIDAQKKIAELMQHDKRKGLTVNTYEKQSLLMEHIQDMEKRLGAYLWLDGCEKTDLYAQNLISAIKASWADITELFNHPVSGDGCSK